MPDGLHYRDNDYAIGPAFQNAGNNISEVFLGLAAQRARQAQLMQQMQLERERMGQEERFHNQSYALDKQRLESQQPLIQAQISAHQGEAAKHAFDVQKGQDAMQRGQNLGKLAEQQFNLQHPQSWQAVDLPGMGNLINIPRPEDTQNVNQAAMLGQAFPSVTEAPAQVGVNYAQMTQNMDPTSRKIIAEGFPPRQTSTDPAAFNLISSGLGVLGRMGGNALTPDEDKALVEAIIQGAMSRVGMSGTNKPQVPPPAQRPVGTKATTDKGTFSWDGQGWVPVK